MDDQKANNTPAHRSEPLSREAERATVAALRDEARTLVTLARESRRIRNEFHATLARTDLTSQELERIVEWGEQKMARARRQLATLRSTRDRMRAARDKLVLSNSGLVAMIAREFAPSNLPLTDLIQEGHIGLLLAIEKFDPQHRTRLTTYASWWIRHTIRRAMQNTGRTVRLPVYILQQCGAVDTARKTLARELGREPTLDEMANATQIARNRIDSLRLVRGHTTVTIEDREPCPSLYYSDHVVDRLAAHQIQCKTTELVATLPDLEGAVVRRRFGLGGERPLSHSQLARHHGLTIARVRELELTAIERLREQLMVNGV